jgi:hypothetical protein
LKNLWAFSNNIMSIFSNVITIFFSHTGGMGGGDFGGAGAGGFGGGMGKLLIYQYHQYIAGCLSIG